MFESSLNVFLVSNFIQCNFLSSSYACRSTFERGSTLPSFSLSLAPEIFCESRKSELDRMVFQSEKERFATQEKARFQKEIYVLGMGFKIPSPPACLSRTPPLVTFLIWPDLHLLTARNPNCLTFISMKTFFHPRDRTTISLSHTLRDEHRLDLPFKPCLACMAWGEILEDFQRWFLALLTHWDGPHKRCWISCLHSLERSSQKQWLWA